MKFNTKIPRSKKGYLAKTKGQSISISSTYIVFLTKMQKRQTRKKGFVLLKNEITGSEAAFGTADILQKAQVG